LAMTSVPTVPAPWLPDGVALLEQAAAVMASAIRPALSARRR